MVKSSPSDPDGQPGLRTTALETSGACFSFFAFVKLVILEALPRVTAMACAFRHSLRAGCLDGWKGRG